ncbi:MAG TPA: hypothetical protein VFW83_06635 [Bryobacteraceae bacterium]|nr:hypothetical protein [Bryobacteraceae bacterium]
MGDVNTRADAKSKTRAILSLILFGIAFGFVEAAVVVYLRDLAQPIRVRAGLPSADLFSLLRADQMGASLRLMRIEVVREGATLVMLAAAAWAAMGNLPRPKAHTWLAGFSLAFGVWDLAFYGWLRVMIGWPASPYTWDLLFLLPVPWAGPVLAPVIIALSLAVGGALALAREPLRIPRFAWALLLGGAAVVLIAFMWDWRLWVAGGMPRAFPWDIFGIGECLGVAGFCLALMRFRRTFQKNIE